MVQNRHRFPDNGGHIGDLPGVCGLCVVLGIARLLSWQWPTKIGETALTLMGTHQLVLYTVPGNSNPLWMLGVTCLIIAVEAVLILAVNHVCPALVGKRRKELSVARNETAPRV